LLSWASPWWLGGLALLPLIRWLHRGGRHRRALPVTHLDLWKGSAAPPDAAGDARPPDAAWRRRALLAALLFAALAQPQLPRRHLPVTLWVDDSLSMLLREPPASAAPAAGQATGGTAGPTRLDAGLARARALLGQVEHADAEVRTLSDPWRDRGPPDDAAVAGIVAGAGRKEAGAPPQALLRGDRLHWLLTDAADAALLDWPGGRVPDRLLQVGHGTRNVGVARLAARRHAGDPGKADVLVLLTNGGTEAETRELILADASGTLERSTQRLPPGATALVQATVPRSEGWRAALQPADALAEDDTLALDAAPLRRRRVALDPACAPALQAAVRAHPALQVAARDGAAVDATLDCSGTQPAAAGPVLRVRAEQTPVATAGPVTWNSDLAASHRLPLRDASLPSAARLAVGAADRVLLARGSEALIVARGGKPARVETSLDFAAMASTSASALPLLLNLMLEQLLGQPLLDAVAVAERGVAASRVAPQALPEAVAGTAASVEPGTTDDLTRPLLMAALLVLLWEMVALLRQARRLRERLQPESA
jgi:hypothetical protein